VPQSELDEELVLSDSFVCGHSHNRAITYVLLLSFKITLACQDNGSSVANSATTEKFLIGGLRSSSLPGNLFVSVALVEPLIEDAGTLALVCHFLLDVFLFASEHVPGRDGCGSAHTVLFLH
jgi:F0F1-type ATP synthase membrane subunit c/vacuolar-type H+-ATPase subunit K